MRDLFRFLEDENAEEISQEVLVNAGNQIHNYVIYIPVEAFKEMDENLDGDISEEEFIKVGNTDTYGLTTILSYIILKACLSHKKFSTMLTLKIIDVFIADDHQM